MLVNEGFASSSVRIKVLVWLTQSHSDDSNCLVAMSSEDALQA